MSLEKCLENPASEDPSTNNIVEICTTPPLSYLLTTVKVIDLEEVCLSDMENVRTAC